MTFVCDSCYRTCEGKPHYSFHGDRKVLNRYGNVMGYEGMDIDICLECAKPPETNQDEYDPHLGTTD